MSISSVNVTKPAGNCRFCSIITDEIVKGKVHFVCYISFITFVLKATSMYFALTYYYYYYTNLYVSSVTEFSKEQNKQSTKYSFQQRLWLQNLF